MPGLIPTIAFLFFAEGTQRMCIASQHLIQLSFILIFYNLLMPFTDIFFLRSWRRALIFSDGFDFSCFFPDVFSALCTFCLQRQFVKGLAPPCQTAATPLFISFTNYM